ncbi:serine/threonine protein kinase [Prescottella agglutinans]|uniref:serine/threonine protein kinase n=1 Tax=Prescottella agglutinans TaxID=1644129 RepID=UPI00247495E0|nr:serine/threonine protein kinase [Prescottella agglutinans]
MPDEQPTTAFDRPEDLVDSYPPSTAQQFQSPAASPVHPLGPAQAAPGYPVQSVNYIPVPPQRNSNAAMWVVVAILAVVLLGLVGYVWVWPQIVNNEASQATTSTSTVVVTTHAAPAGEQGSGPVPAGGAPESVPGYSTRCASVFPSASFGSSAVGSSVTSCEFAEEVRSAYLRQPVRNGTVTISAFSPVTGRSYAMTCSGNAVVTCTGGNDAVVYVY